MKLYNLTVRLEAEVLIILNSLCVCLSEWTYRAAVLHMEVCEDSYRLGEKVYGKTFMIVSH